MDAFVTELLQNWNLQDFIQNFENEGIDEESFGLLDNSTIELLIPKAGPRLKFKKYFKSFLNSIQIDPLDNVSTISNPTSCFSSLEVETSLPITTNTECVTVPDPGNAAECVGPSTINTSDPLPSYPSMITFSKVLDIKGLVRKKLPEIYQKLIEGDLSKINILHKYKINRLLVDSHIQQYDCMPSTKDKVELAQHIVKTFPVLKGTDGEGYEQWFCPGVKGSPSRGFIADRFRNFRSRNFSSTEREELGIKRLNKEPLAKLKNIGAEDSSIEFLQKQQWLKENSQPQDQVLQLMLQTFKGRRYQIFKNPESVIQSWPRLLDPHVIDAEFKLVYDTRKGDSFCSEFGIVSTSIILQARHCGRTAAEEFANRLELDLSTAEPCNEKICCALVLLPMLLPQGIFRKSSSNGAKHMKIKPTWTQSLDHFIQFLPVGEGIEKFMQEDRLLGGERKQPFVLAIGEKLNPIQTFIIFEKNCLEISSLLKAVDVCFKLSYILNLEFSPYCSNVWNFLNSCFYKCDCQSEMASCIRELKERIFFSV